MKRTFKALCVRFGPVDQVAQALRNPLLKWLATLEAVEMPDVFNSFPAVHGLSIGKSPQSLVIPSMAHRSFLQSVKKCLLVRDNPVPFSSPRQPRQIQWPAITANEISTRALTPDIADSFRWTHRSHICRRHHGIAWPLPSRHF
ncbi:hypothetical protein BURKHO8Y_70157 [Burkholderia sp. 8Y]|nr:hypothetical protein BURKHO8Y_70157 [Burkholderia sp. 8Y]